MWLMLQQEKPDDYVISTGVPHSVRDFVTEAFNAAGIPDWEKYVKQDEKYMRPAELFTLQGNNSKAWKKLNWKPKMKFKDLVKLMVDADIKRLNSAMK